MEGMNWGEIAGIAAAAAVPVLVGVLAMLWKKLGKIVAETDNKIDDAAYKAVGEAIGKSKEGE